MQQTSNSHNRNRQLSQSGDSAQNPWEGLSVATLSDSMVCKLKSWLSHLRSSGSTLETGNLKLETEP